MRRSNQKDVFQYSITEPKSVVRKDGVGGGEYIFGDEYLTFDAFSIYFHV